MATPPKNFRPIIHSMFLLIKKMAKFNFLHGIKCGVTGLAKEVHRCRRTVQKRLKDAIEWGLVKEIKRGYKGKKYFSVSAEVMNWFKAGASEKLFTTLLGFPGICTPKCPENAHLSTISSSSLNPSVKCVRGAAPPSNVHKEQKKRREELSFEEVAQEMLCEGVAEFLVIKVCDAVKSHKTPIYSPQRWMRKVLERMKKQSEIKFAKIRENYAACIPGWKKQAEQILYSVSDRFIWKWFGDKVKVTHRGHKEYQCFNITNTNSLYQICKWTGAY